MVLRKLAWLGLLGLGSACSINLGPDSWRANAWGPGVKGSGEARQEIREVGRFDEVSVHGSLDVDVVVDPSVGNEVVVHADDNLLEHIRTEVDDGVLEIGPKRSMRPRCEVWVYVSAERLRAVSMSGSSDVRVSGVDASRFDLGMSGSGDVVLHGRCEQLRVSMSGSGDVDATDLDAQDVELAMSGSGDVDLVAHDRLEVSMSGSGDVRYRGRPRLDTSISGSGDVRGVR